MNLYSLFLKNKKEFFILGIAFLFYVWFVLKYSTVEVLFLGSFYGDIQLVGNYFDGSLQISDLISRFGDYHGMLGYNVLLLINAAIFHYTAYFDIVVNFIIVMVTALILINSISNSLEQKNKIYFFGIFLSSVILFCTMQGTSATMETQVRLGLFFFIISSYLINKLITSANKNILFFLTLVSIIFTINIFGTLYNFAGYPVIFLVLLYLYIFKKDNKAIYILIIYSLCLIGYFFEYDIFLSNSNEGSVIDKLLYWVNQPIQFINAIAAYYGSSVLGWSTYADKVVSGNSYLTIGYTILMINITSIVLYYKSKMSHKTYLPLFLHGYTFFVIILVLIGRTSFVENPWDWGINNWYQVHTKISLVSSIWIMMFTLDKLKYNVKSMNYFISVIFLILLSTLSFGIKNDLKRAPYIKLWYQEFQRWMYINVDEMPINSNQETPLLASYENTKIGLDILKKYKLSVFKNIVYATKLDKNTELFTGKLYNDNWVGANLKMYMNTVDGKLNIDLYLPNEHYSPNSLTIFIDGVSIGTQDIKEIGMHHLEFKTLPNKNVVVRAVFGKSIVPKELGIGEDQRELSAIVNRFEFE